MPWSVLSRIRPSKHSHSSSSSSSSSTTSETSSSSSRSTPLVTPSSSLLNLLRTGHISQSDPQPQPKSVKTPSGLRLRRRKRQTVDAQPKPVQPRLSSLFFPTHSLTAEQEIKCVYRASHAASFADLPSFDTSDVSIRPGGEFRRKWDGGEFQCKQSNYTSLDLTTPTSAPIAVFESSEPESETSPLPILQTSLRHSSYLPNSRYSQSVGTLDHFAEASHRNPYLVLAPLSTTDFRVQRKSVDYTMMATRKERSYSTSGGQGIERGAEIWSSPYDSDTDLPSTANMPPPPVPARSNLRPTASTSNLRDQFSRTGISSNSTPFALPVDHTSRPDFSPSTSSRSHASDKASHPITPPSTSSSTESAFALGRKKRPNAARGGSISGDPMRVRDGTTARESASGVYTPSSFPGLQSYQAARPTASSSKVYTPTTFALPSPGAPAPRSFAPIPPSPSRSTSVSSTSTASSLSEVTTPRTPHTPLTPSSRFLGAVSNGWGGLKRASATLSTRSATSPATSNSGSANMSYTPTSAREGYFPMTIPESAALPAPSSAPSPWSEKINKPYGLGLGLGANLGPEDAGYRRGRSESATSEKFGGALVGDVPKGKRKPVPRAGSGGSEGIKEEVEEEAEVEIVHAM